MAEKRQATGFWKDELGMPYLDGYDFDVGKIVKATVDRIEQDLAYDKETRKKEPVRIAYLKVGDKVLNQGMILTPTKARAMRLVANSKSMKDWVGIELKITSEMQKHFGETFPVIVVS